jgi:hypothetical protein
MADAAVKDLSPASLAYGSCDVRIVMCRRTPNERGEFFWGPNESGSYDEHTPVLRIMRARSPKQLVLVGHACHPTSTGLVDKWSPDYPGSMRRKLDIPDLPGSEQANATSISLPYFTSEQPELIDQYAQAFEKVWARREQLAR